MCEVHPSLMFTRVFTQYWRDIDQKIGPEKIFAGFPIKLNSGKVSVTESWIDRLLRLISHDFDHRRGG